MATVTSLGSTYNTTAGVKTVVATPAVGDFVFVIVQLTAISTDPTMTDDNSDGLGTYTKIGATYASTGTVKSIMGFVRNGPIGSATSTTFTMTPQAGDLGNGLQVFKATGMSIFGSTGCRQSSGQSNQTLGTTPAPVFGAAVLTGNPVIFGLVNATNPAAITPRSSPAYTENVDTGFATPTTGVENNSINSGETATTITQASTSATVFSDYIVELNAALAPVNPKITQKNIATRRSYTW